MAKISTIDIRLLEEVFSSEKGRGYVLDFSDRTFAQFFRDELHINIDDQKYSQDGSSKGKRLRKFLQIEQEPLVARALRALWDYRQTVNGSIDTKDEKAKQQEARFFKLVHAMDGKGGPVRHEAGKPSSGTVNPPQHALTKLNGRLLKLVALKVQERGFAFEGSVRPVRSIRTCSASLLS